MAIITISREFGSGGRIIGRELATALGYAYIDKEMILESIQKRGGPWASWEREMDEACPTLWERFDRSFAGTVALVEEAILEAAAQDRVVVVGRGGNWLLRDIPHAVHVRVVAPLETRIERIMEREQVSRDAAKHLIRKIDHDRACYLRATYRCDCADPVWYDVVLDTARLTYDEVVRLITDLAADKDQRATAEAKEMVKIRALGAKIKATLLISEQVFIPTLEVLQEDKTLLVRGVVRNFKERKAAEEIAHSVAGALPLKFDLHYRI